MYSVYSQLGVTFIQCYRKPNAADKKIISDMWKFYASQHKKSRVRIVLITGDRDFADVVGQLRNVGVDVRILTGGVAETSPVYEDYTLGLKVLPLLELAKRRAKDTNLDLYQWSAYRFSAGKVRR